MTKKYSTVKEFLSDNRTYIIGTGYGGDPIQVCGKFKLNQNKDGLTYILYHFDLKSKVFNINTSFSVSNKTIRQDARFMNVELEPATSLKHKVFRAIFKSEREVDL
jgi:hypothetical protein